MSDRTGPRSEKDENIVVQQVPPKAVPFPFDQVVVAEGAVRRNMSPAEFFALPLAQRILYVVQQKASFFAGGLEVDSKEVLGQMRKLRTQLH